MSFDKVYKQPFYLGCFSFRSSCVDPAVQLITYLDSLLAWITRRQSSNTDAANQRQSYLKFTMPPSRRPVSAWDSPSLSQTPPSYRSHPPSYPSIASSTDSIAGGVPRPYHLPTSNQTSSYSHPYQTSYASSSPGEHSNFEYGSEDGSYSESGSISTYASYPHTASATSDRSGMTDWGHADTGVGGYPSEAHRRLGGFRRTPLSEDERAQVLAHAGQQLLNPTPPRTSGRPRAQYPSVPLHQMSNHPGLEPVGGEDDYHLCLSSEVYDTIGYVEYDLGIEINTVEDIEEILQILSARGNIRARRLLQRDPASWADIVKGLGPCRCTE